MSDEQKREAPLVSITRANDVTLVAEYDHEDGAISKSVGDHWQSMVSNGVKHLFLEHDPRYASLAKIAVEDSEYGRMVNTAIKSGVNVHFYDDRSHEHARNEHYKEESAKVTAEDQYMQDPIGLIAGASNPQKMGQYLYERASASDAELVYRNHKMAENIDGILKQHPGEKALVMVGAAHADKKHDLDEMLRERGHQTATVEINSPYTGGGNLINRLKAEDKSDFVIAAETGNLVSYKAPNTNDMISPLGKSESDIPLRNTEPVAAPASSLDAAKAAAVQVDCSWAKPFNNSQQASPADMENVRLQCVPATPVAAPQQAQR
jgi:hypothetical protein